MYFDYPIYDMVYSQREEEIFLLKNDNKLIKAWAVDFSIYMENFKILEDEGANALKESHNVDMTKVKNKEFEDVLFEVRIHTPKQNLNLRSNGMNMKLCDDLKLLIVLCENNEIVCYNSLMFEVMTVLNLSS